MKKTYNLTPFQAAVKANRKALIESGFKHSALSLWTHGRRIPTWDNAVKLSILLGMPISSVPYRKVELNREPSSLKI